MSTVFANVSDHGEGYKVDELEGLVGLIREERIPEGQCLVQRELAPKEQTQPAPIRVRVRVRELSDGT